MPVDYIASNATDGLALKLYRGEDMVWLAFDIDESLKKPDFVGFGIQYFVGNATQPRDVFNFLTFKRVRLAAKAAKKEIALPERTSMRSPIGAHRATRGTFLNLGFTRGFASSQAYERNFPNQRKIMPQVGKPQLGFDT